MTFTFSVSAADWGRIAPELILAAMALLLMIVDILRPQAVPAPRIGVPPRASASAAPTMDAGTTQATDFTLLPAFSILGLAGAFAATCVLFAIGDQQTAFNQMIGSDYGSLYAYLIILSAAILAIILSPTYLKRLNLVHQGEYYALMLLATIGMMLLASATSFLMVFLGLELLSLALYILCSFVTRRKSSQESGMKYFLLSSFASAFLLYGIALTYGATGSTTFANIRYFLISHIPNLVTISHPIRVYNVLPFQSHTLFLVAMGLLIVGFAFKVSAIPFQAWTPDVYDGAPAPVTAFMSVGTKAAALIAFARVFDVVFAQAQSDWMPVIWAITILTIIGGNILALVQTNTKRLLAYSSIAHAGYLLIGVVAGGVVGISAILFYLFCYTFLNLGAFGIVSVLEQADNSGSSYSDIRGLWYRRPILAGLLALFLLALAGFPPMAGFAAKYYIFYAAIQSGHPELLIVGVLASVLGMYYYLRVIATMFMEQEKEAVATAMAVPSIAPVTNKKRAVGAQFISPFTTTAIAAKPTASVAVAVKPATTGVGAQFIAPVGWWSWTALVLALVGTFAMGTVLPFWLVNLAQQAAQMMLR